MVDDGAGDWRPPVLEHLTLENPWPLAGVLLAVALPVVAHFVVSPREAMIAQTRGLIAAVTDPFNEAALAEGMTDGAQLAVGDYNLPRAAVLELAKATLGRTPITATYTARLDARLDTPRSGKTLLGITATLKDSGVPAVSMRWLLGWRLGDDGRWRLSRATLQTLGDQPARASDLTAR